ncbi:hypothetical protein ACFVAQ_45520, partial [Streptomyces sp. NPDC057651]|uniref:hypothetical protein n=1 Tax=Streptomyces sp. NPDC057651 TaxID=3346194 RepID=UPI0036873CF7
PPAAAPSDDERRARYEAEATPWYEVINPRNATTNIAMVYDDGSLYLPEGTDALTVEEFHFAAAQGKAYRLIRVVEAIAMADAARAMIPAAARAVAEAAAWDAHRLAVDHPADVAEHVLDALAEAGWTITAARLKTDDQQAR